MSTILVVDDEKGILKIIAGILKSEGFDVITASGGKEAVEIADEVIPDLIFLDVIMKNMDGIATLKILKKKLPSIPIVMLTAYGSVESAVKCMKNGADDYIDKSNIQNKLVTIAKNFIKTKELSRQVSNLKTRIDKLYPEKIIGESSAIRQIFKAIKKAAVSDINVLITGESGTGKELVARAIHNQSKRKDKPLVEIDCTVLPDTLVESELFGYEKGAFTGASIRKLGKFELANSGTLFLDEIGNIPFNVQQKLLKIIEEKKFSRLGGNNEIKIDVRLITATNINLGDAVKLDKFRSDLYYRLNVFSINLPPLRERKDDIPLIVDYFVGKYCQEQHKEPLKISESALNALVSYNWPGNVRELRNVIERAVLLADAEITIEHIPENIQTDELNRFGTDDGLIAVGKRAAYIAERKLLMETLGKFNWNKTKVAQKLKIDYKTLFNKMKEYNIKR